ncbi:MAG: leucyl/phenylalanyl-tRNA--protein transferase [Pseudomonadota bacterium]
MLHWLQPDEPFPPVEAALTEPNGLLCAGLDLSPARILDAYRHGIFPWFNPGEPVLWWSPDPRMVLVPGEVKVSRSLKRRMKRGGYEVRVDTSFREVMLACAAPRAGQTGTWIGRPMLEAYGRLHEMGYAHSVETWMDGELAGGLYGMAIGRMFYGESMFSRRTDASKLALVHLCRQLETWGFGLIDCQMETAHLASMGAKPIPRRDFIREMKRLLELEPVPSPWRFEPNHVSH